MENPIVTIETAIVNRLVLHNSTPDDHFKWPFKCKYIDSYGGQFDTAEEMAQAAQRAPGLWVTYDGESGRLENGYHRATINYAVFVLAKNYTPEKLRHGGPGQVGLYQLIEAVRLALVNQTLGRSMTPLELLAVTPLWRGGPQGGGLSLAVMRLTCQVLLTFEPNFELDETICPAPLYVAAWDVPGFHISKTTDQWSVKDVSETKKGGQGLEP